MGSMYAAVLFVGITNATAVQPVVSIERFVSYRERAAGMYSALPFAIAQVFLNSAFFFFFLIPLLAAKHWLCLKLTIFNPLCRLLLSSPMYLHRQSSTAQFSTPWLHLSGLC